MSERLERVAAFSELRETDYVEVNPCAFCGGKHRSILVGPYDDHGRDIGFEKLGDPCGGNASYPPTVWRGDPGSSVREGRLFRVLDGLEEPSTETAAASPAKQPTKENA